MSSSRMTIESPFDKTIPLMEAKWQAATWALVNAFAPRVQGYAQTNAPWQDQTGNARQGLKARAGQEELAVKVFIDVFHTMPYGIYLETRWSGRYQIIVPTIKTMGRELMAAAAGLLGRL